MSEYEILFAYDENNAKLRVEYDAKKNEVTVTGSKEGYAGLALLFKIYSNRDCPPAEHTHWYDMVDTDYLFVIERK